MGFTSAPWALDGARTPGSIARLAARAAVKESGIVNPGDLKVLPLSTPGDGVRISSGGGVLENRYEMDVNQAYVVEATSEEIVGAEENFVGILGQGTTQHHLVCVTVADPQYSTAGHPWFTETMKNDLAANPEDALDFQYTRAWVIKNVPAGTERVEDLPSPPTFPCYAVARIEVPNGSGSITSGMIKDLRSVVNPRTRVVQTHVAISTPDALSVPAAFTYETWPDNSDVSVYIPEWATKVYIQGYIYGFVQGSNIQADAPMRVALRTSGGTFVAANQQTVYYHDLAGENQMVSLAGPIAIPVAQRGTTCRFSTEASYSNTSQNLLLATTTRTSVSLTLRFVEEAV